ncbi:ComEA family DNA-binding protein [Halorhodospira halophila]|uniref:ComEA family DNA-binding protein n=1 Tax=Halorhodospira halophila TaxID=1053 RepID=UPI003D365997
MDEWADTDFDHIGDRGGSPAAHQSGCVDINTASRDQLQEIVHIDQDRAREIERLRERSPFTDVSSLRTRVQGIGPQRVEEIIEQDKACVP